MKTINLKAYTKPRDDENLVEVGKGNSLLHVYKDVTSKTKDELNKYTYKGGCIMKKDKDISVSFIEETSEEYFDRMSKQDSRLNELKFRVVGCETKRIRGNVSNIEHVQKPFKGLKELRDSINKEIEVYERDKVRKERQKESLKFVGFLAIGLWLGYIYITPFI